MTGTHPYKAALTETVAAARDAGALLKALLSGQDSLAPSSKRAGDFVSQADLRAEALLRHRLCGPDDHWLGEETGSATKGAQRVWIVDPLDGTTNYLRGIGHWAVSIALEEAGTRVLGVVYDPTRDECFCALAGGGAWLNGQSIAPAPTPLMRDALFGTGIPFGTMAYIDDHAADIARLMPHCAGVRRMGAAALDLAYVACGRLDGFWERRLQPWDIAAGLVLLGEAGAVVDGLVPGTRPEDTGTVLTATPALFDAIAQVLRAP
ncbi:Inositol-1-monophosphatase [Roseibaca ekhonensis]|jgi:myo-inositol-1(or 4)-monophosphatase|uniref:Inositol-1-monophosphatase n=1 Tax=Roseinatronobacter ekhonensis TaxID=254356 RepID=A0A3B0MRQ2_9RHOB|nr:inositol monophosphatase family protein [Roseibaca ekhonensis]SUZ32299.1 Inositol-1-monophosphatase [Roseibaca ekhonensis]